MNRTHSSPASGESPAERLFRASIRSGETDPDRLLIALTRDHPEHRAEFEDLVAEWRLVRELAASTRPGNSVGTAVDMDEWRARIERLRHGSTPARYRLGGEIARGGMGVVHEVFDEELRRRLAMKVLLDDGAVPSSVEGTLDPGSVRRFARFVEEAQVTAQLGHPGIVPVHEVGVNERGELFFTMELVEGESLHRVLDRRSRGDAGPTLPGILSMLLRACDAVAYAHACGVVHRDLKPSNIMVGRFGQTYVMDWGLARVDGAVPPPSAPKKTERSRAIDSDRRPAASESGGTPLLTVDGEVLGTPVYMSPEQARGEIDRVDARSDVYAMGAILYEVLAGHPPYCRDPAAAPRDVLERLRRGAPEPLDREAREASPELIAICTKAMAREPAERYATMEEFAADLRAYLEGRVVAAHRTGPWVEFTKWARRNRTVAITVGLALLTLAGVVWVALDQIRRERDAAVRGEENVLRLADVTRLSDLTEQANTLWPATPDRVAAFDEWLAQARDLLSREPIHRSYLDELRRLGAPAGDRGIDGTEAALHDDLDRSYRFEDHTLTWKHDTLVGLLKGLRRLRDDDPHGATVTAVERRRSFASRLVSLTLGEHDEDWQRAIASIADRAECPQYDGLFLPPQLGFVPLGRDPDSGLWEFWHIASGERPARGDDGKLVVGGDSGMVFVLIPGGDYTVGAQSSDPAAAHYDPKAGYHEGPVQTVALDPFLLSKFELTQGQWSRMTGDRPSHWFKADPRRFGDGHPVDEVSWSRAMEVLQRFELDLPTEVQWEVGCRAGTDTPWSFATEDAARSGNFADEALARAIRPSQATHEPFDDGFGPPGPVGSFAPNPFGLYDMHGNLAEWCRDPYDPRAYHTPPAPSNGLREGAHRIPGMRVTRGGGCDADLAGTRSTSRHGFPEDHANELRGLRPAASLDPE